MLKFNLKFPWKWQIMLAIKEEGHTTVLTTLDGKTIPIFVWEKGNLSSQVVHFWHTTGVYSQELSRDYLETPTGHDHIPEAKFGISMKYLGLQIRLTRKDVKPQYLRAQYRFVPIPHVSLIYTCLYSSYCLFKKIS